MRDQHLTATDNKIKRIRTYKKVGKRIWKMIKATAVIILVISLFSTLNTILINQSDDAIRDRDILDKLNLIDQSIDPAEESRSTGQIESRTGTFTVTHYCLENYPHICNDGDSTQTASGETPIPYYTIAADESIPFGTMMEIDGQIYEVMDRGGSITENRIDIAVPTHAEALSRGKFEREVRY